MDTSPCQRLLLVGSGIALAGALAEPSLRLILLCLLLLLVPGYLLERLLPLPRSPLLVRSAIWIALSLSLNALLYQWLWATGLSLSASVLWLGCGLIGASGLVAAWRDLAAPWSPCSATWSNLLTVGIVAVTLWARMGDIATLTFPPWVDSVHHALLIRIAAETGSAPSSLQPYLPVEDLPYHWGYHVFSANLLRLGGLDLLETMLISGQLLNALQALTVAALAQQLWRRPLAAPIAALIVGCCSLMPAYYLSWGRYTQLTGLLMLPGLAIVWAWGLGGSRLARRRGGEAGSGERGGEDAKMRSREREATYITTKEPIGTQKTAVPPPLSHNVGAGAGGEGHPRSSNSLAIEELEQPKSRGRLAAIGCRLAPWLLGSLILAGLSLVHFIVLNLSLALLGSLTLVWMLQQPWLKIRTGLTRAIATALGSMALAAPWLTMLFQRSIVPSIGNSGLVGGGSYNAFNSGLLWVGPNYLLVALALIGAWVSLQRRLEAPVIILLWVSFMFIMANPWLLNYLLPAIGLLLLGTRQVILIMIGGGLLFFNPFLIQFPYLWLITNDAVVISLFIPLAILISGGGMLLYKRLERRSLPQLLRTLLPTCGLIIFTTSGIWGIQGIQTLVLNPNTIMGSPAELAAIRWIKEQTPNEARFLVNAAPWLPTARRGADAGWWLMPLAERWTTAPPVLFDYGQPDYVRHVNLVNDTIINYTPGQEQVIFELIASEGITHIYLVDGRGPLERSIFMGREGFRVVYDLGGVVIIRIE